MRNIAYCYVFHRQRARLRPESILMPFISCKGNHKHEAFFQIPAMRTPMASPIQNKVAFCLLVSCSTKQYMLHSGDSQVTAPPSLGYAITRSTCSPAWPHLLAHIPAHSNGRWMPNSASRKQQRPRPHPSKAITSVYLNFSLPAFPLQASSYPVQLRLEVTSSTLGWERKTKVT